MFYTNKGPGKKPMQYHAQVATPLCTRCTSHSKTMGINMDLVLILLL